MVITSMAHQLIEMNLEKMHLRRDRLTVSSAAHLMMQYGMDARLLRNAPERCVNIVQKTMCAGVGLKSGVCDCER